VRPATARLKSTALAAALVALAVLPSAALATTDRADYAAQVNPICASANARDQQLTAQAEERFAQLHRELRKARGHRREKLLAQDRKLTAALPDRHLGIHYDELKRLQTVAAAPGDEFLVSSWLDARKSGLDLNHRLNQIDRRAERLLKRTANTIDIETLNTLDRKIRELDKRANRLENKVISAENTDFDLGSELGANDCITDFQ
jgi:hypothetical protein